MDNNLPPQVAMTQMILGYVPVKAINAAAKLNIADLIAAHGPTEFMHAMRHGDGGWVKALCATTYYSRLERQGCHYHFKEL